MAQSGIPLDSLSPVEQTLAQQEFEAPRETTDDVVALPPRHELLKRFGELSAHIYDNPRETASRLVDRAVITIALGESDVNPGIRVASILHDLSAAQRAHWEAGLMVPSHEVWSESPFELYVREPQLERNLAVTSFNTKTSTLETKPENDASLELRRYLGQSLFISSLERARVERLLSAFTNAFTDNEASEAQHTALLEIAQEELKPKADIEPADAKINQARAVLEAGIYGDHSSEVKTSLLNLALDTAMGRVDSLPNQQSIASAEAYLIAGRAVHDLASRHGSFPQLSEAEARGFRVRALELAHDFVLQAATTYEEIFDTAIGPVNAETHAGVLKSIQTFEHEVPLINEARWFRGIYEGDYKLAAKSYTERVRHIGEKGLIHALTSSIPRADLPQELVPQAPELAIAA